jgi:DNA polymerase V
VELPEIKAGFPSPAQDYVENGIDLNRELVKNPSSTFFGRARGSSMEGAGIFDGDLLIIDKSLEPREGAIAVCFIDGEFTLKRIHFEKHEGQVTAIWLQPENEQFTPIKVTQDNQFIIWGIVVHSVRSF